MGPSTRNSHVNYPLYMAEIYRGYWYLCLRLLPTAQVCYLWCRCVCSLYSLQLAEDVGGMVVWLYSLWKANHIALKYSSQIDATVMIRCKTVSQFGFNSLVLRKKKQ